MSQLSNARRQWLRRAACAAAACACAAVPGTRALAQATTEAAIKAAFLFKFGSFVEWPAGTFTRTDQPLVIAVSGDEEMAAELEQVIAGRHVEGRPVVIRRVGDGGLAPGAHILFLGTRRESRLRETIEAVQGPVLIVTTQPGGLQAGSVLNFTTEGSRVRFAASLAAADARNLKLSARLLAVAQTVEGRPR